MKRIFKSVFAAFAVLAVTLALVACGPKEVEVSFDADGVVETIKVEKGGLVPVREVPAKEGHTGVWQLDGVDFDFANTKVETNIRLVAKYSAAEYTVTFELGEADAASLEKFQDGVVEGSTVTYTVKHGDKIANPGELTSALKAFGGYKVEVNGELVDFNFDNPIKGDVAITVVWNKIPITITLNAGDGNILVPQRDADGNPVLDADGEPVMEEVKERDINAFKGDTIRTPADPVIGEEVMLVFAGWEMEGFVPSEDEPNFTFYHRFMGDTVLNAKWVEAVKVNYVLNGGEELKGVSTKVAKDAAARLVRPSHKTHAFAGWFLDVELTQMATHSVANLQTVDPVTAELTVYAKWEPITLTVSFGGAGEMAPIKLNKGDVVDATAWPVDPVKEGFVFDYWTLDGEEFTAEMKAAPVMENLVLVAFWQEINAVVTVDDRINPADQTTLVYDGVPRTFDEPAAPTPKEGFKFEGWYRTPRGLSWLEPEKLTFPLNVNESITLYAYYEPVNSKTANWSKDETYTSSLTSDTIIILNPLTYQWSHEADYMDSMSTPLYSTEVDWDKAIEDGVADFPGDFSKIDAGEFSINVLDYHYILVGATHYPQDQSGNEFLNDRGNYDRVAGTKNTDTKWTYNLRQDVMFEDGTVVDAYVWEYTLKQFLSPVQNNYRANSYYKTEDNKNGYAIKNAYEYFKGQVEWSEVGFKVIDRWTFEVEFFEPTTQSTAVGFGSMNLVHPEKYAASLDANGQNSTYGTPEQPFVSYGAYIIKSWDENQKIVFNKNFDYILKGTINYKSMVEEIVDDQNAAEELFSNGTLSVFGVTKDHYAKYADRSGLKRSYSGYPQNLLINLAPSKDTSEQGHKHQTILFDKRFRQALFFGFDRNYYGSNVYAPNEPSMVPFPGSARAYLQDPNLYIDSAQHKAVLDEFGITDYLAYMDQRAIQLFEQAYADWLAEGNKGPVRLRLIGDNDDFSKALTNFVKDNYEDLFKKDGVKRLIVDVIELESDALRAQISAWNFDLYFGSVGFGANYGAHWQMPFIAFAGSLAGGGDLGMTQPMDESGTKDALGRPTDDKTLTVSDYWFENLNIELHDTFQYLFEQDVDNYTIEEAAALEGYVRLWEALQEVKDKNGNVVKAEGIYTGTVADLVDIMMNTNNPFDGSAEEPFPGAGSEANEIIAAFERIFIENAPIIPAVTRSGATLYADNVCIEWPEFSVSFGWGSARYRYLTTDPDFAHLAPTPAP